MKLNFCPLYLINPKILDNKMFDSLLNDMSIDMFTNEYKNSDLSFFKYINSFDTEIKSMNKKTKNEFFKAGSFLKVIIISIYFEKANSLFKFLQIKINKETLLNDKINESVTDFPSFSSAIFSIFLKTIQYNKLPAIPSCAPGNIRNTSKYEISFCNVINKYHLSKFKNHEIKSYVNGDGQQFQIKPYSSDWYCKQCKIAIFIEGNFKYICKKHERSVKHVFKNENRKQLHISGEKKRKQLKKKAFNEVLKTFVIGQCCIVKNDYSNEFKKSNLFYGNFGDDVLNELKIYNKEKYTRMNYQKAIQPAFTLSLSSNFESDGSSIAKKFDINSAYLSVLTDTSFMIPCSNIPDTCLVNKDANKFFHSLELDDKNFGFVKAFIIKKNFYNIPYIPFINDNELVYYKDCPKCTSTSELCSHNENEKGFFTTGYLNDFLFMKSIGYTVNVVQIIYFRSFHNNYLHYLADLLLELRKNKCDLTKTLAKKAALVGIGRFALNVNKIKNDVAVIDNVQELLLGIENEEIQNIECFKNTVVGFKQQKITNYMNAQMSTRLNCSSFLFGSISNIIRKEMYEFYMYIVNLNNPDIEMLRIDTDSVIIKCRTRENIQLINKFMLISKFIYKIESDNITCLINFGRQSHYFVNDNKKVLKVCGLRISTGERYNLKNDYFKKYIKNIKH